MTLDEFRDCIKGKYKELSVELAKQTAEFNDMAYTLGLAVNGALMTQEMDDLKRRMAVNSGKLDVMIWVMNQAESVEIKTKMREFL